MANEVEVFARSIAQLIELLLFATHVHFHFFVPNQ
jgi:hypothetical protein